MAYSINKVVLVGKLGRDAESNYIPSGKMVTKFSVATDHSYKDSSGEWQRSTNWTNCAMWSNEKLAPLLVKGSMVAVEGRLETRSYEDKQGQKRYVTEVVADNVVLCGGSSGEGSSAKPQRSQASPFDGDDSEEVPF